MLLLGNQFALYALIRVIKVKVLKLNICKGFKKIDTTVVAQDLRLPNRVLHHLTREGIESDQSLGHGLSQNPNHRPEAHALLIFVAEKHPHVHRRQKQVKVGEWQPVLLQWQGSSHHFLLDHGREGGNLKQPIGSRRGKFLARLASQLPSYADQKDNKSPQNLEDVLNTGRATGKIYVALVNFAKHACKIVELNMFSCKQAYLAYGVPRSDLKLFSLMQKAAYTVGGHSFSAAAIEYVILKMKPPLHRPQIALLLALHKLKVSDEQRKSAIDVYEPLITFALSCGMYSSPAVRIYTAKNVRDELQEAQRDFVRASVGVSSKGRLLVPKMLHCFAKGIVDDSNLAVWISHYLPPHQATFVEQSISQRRQSLLGSRNCGILPFDSRFRFNSKSLHHGVITG
ncbi:HXXXD-type acyl-transferase family protein [Prunus dulcis]|uniref:HXXXD-type acyl-transferase family protein n=1 Tax=Prunus dulcis TaxID=3755 RepID=A0A4Y1R3T1_PRUDU|nr:HXXXD-type acyl-transferase family protein [Prunus dulcis]